MRPSAACTRNQVGSVCGDVDRAVEVGPEHARTALPEPLNGLWRWVAVWVAPSGADYRHLRPGLFQEVVGGCGAAAVVRHLQDVDLLPVGD